MELDDFPKVKDYMSKLPPVSPSTLVKDVAKLFSKYKSPILAVCDKDRIILGAIDIYTLLKPFIPDFIDFIDDFSFISHLGALEHKIFSGEMSALFLAADIMEREYPSVEEDDSVVKALFSMHKRRISGLVVKKDNIYKGIITRCNLLEFLYDIDH